MYLALCALLLSVCVLSVRSQAGSSCSSPSGARGTCVNTNSQQCNGQLLTGRCPGASNIRCCIRGSSSGSTNSGSSNGGQTSGNTNSGGSGSFGSFPTSLTTNGYTYTGQKAQVLHFLKQRFGASATTYAGHSDGPLFSADLWASVSGMNTVAEYVAANLGTLGIRYVIWKQRINQGSGWKGMADRGSRTANHFDHVHITFQGSGCRGKSCRATAADENAFSTTSVAPSPLPGWAIGLIAISVFIAIATIVLVVLVAKIMNNN